MKKLHLNNDFKKNIDLDLSQTAIKVNLQTGFNKLRLPDGLS